MKGFIEVENRYGDRERILIAISEISSVDGSTIITKSTVYEVYQSYNEIKRLIEEARDDEHNTERRN